MSRDLSDLITRLEAAKGPDQAIDWELHVLRGLEGVGMYGAHPAYTTSLDAALALAARVLPKHHVNGLVDRRHVLSCSDWMATLSPLEPQDVGAHGFGPTPALAICIALCRALQAQGEDE